MPVMSEGQDQGSPPPEAASSESAVVVASNGSKRLVRIGNVLVEVDLSTARPARSWRVGDTCIVHEKGYSAVNTYDGWIMGVIEFAEGKIAVEIAVFKRNSYGSQGQIEFMSIVESDSDRITLAPARDMETSIEQALAMLDGQIAKDTQELQKMLVRRNRFAEVFQRGEQKLAAILVDAVVRRDPGKVVADADE
jgi:hypothetical protein